MNGKGKITNGARALFLDLKDCIDYIGGNAYLSDEEALPLIQAALDDAYAEGREDGRQETHHDAHREE